MKRAAATLVIAAVLASPAEACTTFCIGDSTATLFGKNYDYSFDDGFVIVNQRGVAKVSFSEEQPARWVSRFGSVTFNQYGRELPSGGMNERGLVVELMWLDGTQYPAPDDRAVLPALQWIQYQLDNHETVDEVVASDADVRIDGTTSATIHFLVADGAGNVAAIEFLDGALAVHRGADLPLRALTNNTYEESLAYARSLAPGAPPSTSSLDRFALAARNAAWPGRDRPGDDRAASSSPATVERAFSILSDVAQGEFTCWSIVYDIAGRVVHFRTRRHEPVRSIALAGLDYRCGTPVLGIDVHRNLSGRIEHALEPYSLEKNRALIEGSFAKTDFLRGVPAETITELAKAPERMVCERGER
jgi:choloylglycine hydrolase